MAQQAAAPSNDRSPIWGGSGSSFGKVVCALSLITVVSKGLGFAEKVVVAHFFGTTQTADIYFAVMGIVLSIAFLVKELIYPSLLPVMSETICESPLASGALFGKAFRSVAVLMVSVAVVAVVFASTAVRTLVPGFSGSQQAATARVLQWMAPGVICLCLLSVTYTALNARRRFLLAAIGDAGMKLLIVCGMLGLIPLIGIHALPAAIAIAGLGCLLFQLYCLPDSTYLLRRVCLRRKKDPFKRMLFLMLPLAAGVVFSRISDVVDNLLASGCPTGQLSYLNYGKRLVDAALLMGPVAVVTVMYPHISRLASLEDREGLITMIRRSMRLLLFISVPMACLLLATRRPLLQCLFQRGSFGASSTAGTADALAIYSLGLVALAFDGLVVYSYYALCDTKTPVAIGVVCVLLNIVLAAFCVRRFGYLGIAGALVIAKTIKVGILAFWLHVKLDRQLFRGWTHVSYLVKLAASACAMCLLLWLAAGFEPTDGFLHAAAYGLVIPCMLSVGMFLGVAYLLRVDECERLVAAVVRNVEAFRRSKQANR